MVLVMVKYAKTHDAIYLPANLMPDIFFKACQINDIELMYDKDDKPIFDIYTYGEQNIESIAEVIVLSLVEPVKPTFMIRELNQALPSGIVVLSVNQIPNDSLKLNDGVESIQYELKPDFKITESMTNKEVATIRENYRMCMYEFIEQPNIYAILKSGERSERVDVKPYIVDYKLQINDSLQVTIKTNKVFYCSPRYIIDAYNKYSIKEYDFEIKKTKLNMLQ